MVFPFAGTRNYNVYHRTIGNRYFNDWFCDRKVLGSMQMWQMCQNWGTFGSFALPVIYVLATYFRNYVTTYAPMVPLLGTRDFFFV